MSDQESKTDQVPEEPYYAEDIAEDLIKAMNMYPSDCGKYSQLVGIAETNLIRSPMKGDGKRDPLLWRTLNGLAKIHVDHCKGGHRGAVADAALNMPTAWTIG